MPGFSSYDDLIDEITTNGKVQNFNFMKPGGTAPAAGIWYSLARLGGMPPAISDGAAGSGTPGAGGTALTNASGTLNGPDVSTDRKAIVTFGAVATVAQTLRLYDRLVHVSGVTMNSTGTKNIGSAALPRYTGTDSVGNEVWIEFTTAGTTTANVCNLLTYTDQNGNTGQVGGSLTAPATAMVLNSMYGPFPLAAGDTGVQSVETFNVGTACTAGVGQLIIMRPLVEIYLPANQWVEQDFVLQLSALPRVFDGASLQLMTQVTATTATNFWGRVRLAYG